MNGGWDVNSPWDDNENNSHLQHVSSRTLFRHSNISWELMRTLYSSDVWSRRMVGMDDEVAIPSFYISVLSFQ